MPSGQNKVHEQVDPASGRTIGSVEMDSEDVVESKIARAYTAARNLRHSSVSERTVHLRKVAHEFERARSDLAQLMAREMGKPVKEGLQEVDSCVKILRYYAQHAQEFLNPEPVKLEMGLEAEHAYVVWQPLGLLLGIMPWNFPLKQVVRFAAPALAAGNGVLVKHASLVPGCARRLEELFARGGFDQGEYTALLIESERVEDIIRDDRVRGVSLTGSAEAGAKVAATAGAVLKRVVLELGGSDPFIVMPSADLQRAAQAAVRARTVNSGESCIAAKRFFVHEAVAEEFEREMARPLGPVRGMQALRMGSPLDPETDVGPLASAEQRDTVERQLRDSLRVGGRLLCGGQRGDGPGFYWQPTLVADAPDDSPLAREEVFGPVAALWRVSSLSDALQRANRSEFGLGAVLWSREPHEHERFVREVESGLAFINAVTQSTPELPFSGVKRSGVGRELSVHGMREFMVAKSVVVGKTD